MRESKHTPEPWLVESFTWPIKLRNKRPGRECVDISIFGTACEVARCGVYVGQKAQPTTDNGLPFREAQCEANAERIVACVNALAGLDPAGVKALVEAADALIPLLDADLDALEMWQTEIDNLRSALSAVRE